MQSVQSLNNLIPFTIFFSFDFLSLDKILTLRIDKNRNPPDWQKEDPSGLAKIRHFRQKQDPLGLAKTGPLRIGKIGTPPDWQNWDPCGLAKLGLLWIGKIGTPPDWQNWDPSGFVKIAFQRLPKFSPDTLPDTFSDAIMLFELTREGVFSFPRPFRFGKKSTPPDWQK